MITTPHVFGAPFKTAPCAFCFYLTTISIHAPPVNEKSEFFVTKKLLFSYQRGDEYVIERIGNG